MAVNLPRTAKEIQEEAVTFDLTPYAERFYEMQNEKVTFEAAKRIWEASRDRFKAMAGNANQFMLNGIVVATHAVSGPFNKSRFAKEQPHIYEQFLVEVTVQVFDEDAFAAAHPNLYNSDEYRARSLRFKL